MGHTPGPWKLGEYDEHLGYDCMTGGVRAGPVVLDGHDYGQRNCAPISEEALARMMADARLIASAPDLEREVAELREQLRLANIDATNEAAENAELREALGALVNRTKNIGPSKFGARANYDAFLDAWMAARELTKSPPAQGGSV